MFTCLSNFILVSRTVLSATNLNLIAAVAQRTTASHESNFIFEYNMLLIRNIHFPVMIRNQSR